METQAKPVSTFSVALPLGLAYGLFSGLKFILFETRDIETAAESGGSGIEVVLPWMVAIGLVIFAHLQFRKRGNGFMTYGQGFTISILMGIFGGIVAAICLFIYTQFIDPGYTVAAREFAIKEASKNTAERDMELVESIVSFTTLPIMLSVFKWLLVCFLYLILGLIVSIFTKNENTAAPF